MTKSQKATVAVLIAGAFLSVLNQTLMNPALPTVMSELSISATTAQWLVSGFTLVNAITVAVSAFLIDRFSMKHLFIASFTLFLAGSLLAAWGVSFPVLLAGRFLQAVCAGVMIPMTITTLLLIFPYDHRGAAMGMYSFVIMFAPSIGPAISGFLTDTIGWHVTFAGMAGLSLVVILVALFGMKERGETKAVTLDKLSLLLAAAGLFSLLYGFSVLGEANTLLLGGGMILLGCLVLAWFSRRQLRLPRPFLRIQVLRDRQFRLGTIILMIISMSLTAATITLPLYVQTVRDMSATVSGMIMMPGAILGAASGYFAGRLSDRIGVRPLAVTGVTCVIIGSAGMAFWGFDTPVAVLIVIYCLRYIGLMLANTPINLWAIAKLDDATLNHGNAVSSTMRQVASTLGTAVMVSVMSLVASLVGGAPDEAELFGMHATFYLSTAIALVSFALILLHVRSNPKVIAESAGDAQLRAVMNENPPTVCKNDSLAKAIRVFVEYRTGDLAVTDPSGAFCGFLSDRDLVRYLASHDVHIIDTTSMLILPGHSEIGSAARALLEKNVMELTNVNIVAAEYGTPLAEVCKLFYDRHLHKMPVLRGGLFVGTISRIDVLHYLLKQVNR